MAVSDAFEAWRSSSTSTKLAHILKLLDIDEDPSGPRLEIKVASVAVTIMVPAEEDATFFVDSESGTADVEEWVSDINSYFAEKPTAKLKELLDFMAKTLPAKFENASGGDDDEEMADEPEVDELAIQDIDVHSEEWQAKRQAFAEEQQIERRVEQSLSHSQSSRQASQTLMREMVALQRLKDEGKSDIIQIELVDDSLYHWRVFMPAEGFPDKSDLKKDLLEFARRSTDGGDSSGGAGTKKAGVLFDVVFPGAFPFSPPFIRVVYPRFQFHTGHVTVGGSICMELLTEVGWLPTYSIESVFVQIRTEICEGGGRIDFANAQDYSEAEAMQAFERVARQHGWIK